MKGAREILKIVPKVSVATLAGFYLGYLRGRSFPSKMPTFPSKILLSLQYVRNYIRKMGVSWCCGNYCLLAFVLWCGYCSVSFQSFVLRHWCPQHQETTGKIIHTRRGQHTWSKYSLSKDTIVSQNAPDCISAHIHFTKFPGWACPRIPLGSSWPSPLGTSPLNDKSWIEP